MLKYKIQIMVKYQIILSFENQIPDIDFWNCSSTFA